MPNSIVTLEFINNKIDIKLELPIQELELAFGKDITTNPDIILTNYKNDIQNYLINHLKILSDKNVAQSILIKDLSIQKITTQLNGDYSELIANVECILDANFNSRDFYLQYDVVIHQVATHFAVIKIGQDLANGITPNDSVELGIIQLDIGSNTIKPLHIKLEEGNHFKGLKKMFVLGMKHIYSGLDHLLFILTLILIAPLSILNSSWDKFMGWKFAFYRLLKIISAFTIGHSVTLLIFSFFNLNDFSYFIEIAISLTIIIAAIHAIKPILSSKETFITFFFGLIHGSAFGISISSWGFSDGQKILSLLSFNLGIELMQLIVILFFIPLIYLSKYKIYKPIRVFFAVVTIFVSLFWLLERITKTPNIVTEFVNNML